MTTINSAIITYFGEQMHVACDRQCGKAWGINNRPRVQLSDDDDDYVFLADGELGEAPANPGTYEGGHPKPLTPDNFPNRWCVRECERSERGEVGKPLVLHDWNQRFYNMPRSGQEQSS